MLSLVYVYVYGVELGLLVLRIYSIHIPFERKGCLIKAQLSYVLPIYLWSIWSMRFSVQSALCDDDD